MMLLHCVKPGPKKSQNGCHDIQHNDTQHNNKQNATLSIMVQCYYPVSFMFTVVYDECRKLVLYAECHYVERRYAECRGAIESVISWLCLKDNYVMSLC
jgi:hypothetical protein